MAWLIRYLSGTRAAGRIGFLRLMTALLSTEKAAPKKRLPEKHTLVDLFAEASR